MIILKPLLTDSYIPRTPINISYSDETPSVNVITSLTKNGHTADIKIEFTNVAKVEIISVYFPEFHSKNYEILATHTKFEDCGFFEVMNGIDVDLNLFDPHQQFNLKLFLVYGYDSYAQILSSGYAICDL